MFDFIPVYEYTPYFHYTILALVLLAFWQCNTGTILDRKTVSLNSIWGFLFTIALICYMGYRPISGVFGDTINYAKGFYEMQEAKEPFVWKWEGDALFYNLHRWFAVYSDIHSFFLLCSAIYVGCLWLAMRRIFRDYYYIPLLVTFSMFTFWSYGVNGIRNGMAASMVILAMTYVNRVPVMCLLALIGVGFHKSAFLMVAASALAWHVKDSRHYLMGWIACVVISYTFGGALQGWMATLDVMGDDDRFSGYLTGENMVGEYVQMSMVFRWDFLLYSSVAVAVGAYFIFIRNFRDEYYHWWYNSFLVMNGFWVLIIRAAYSNRFAQISWFIMPIILIYPFLRQRFWLHHEKYLGLAILVFYVFTFYFNIVKGG